MSVLTSAFLVRQPFSFVRADFCFEVLHRSGKFGFGNLAFPNGDDIPFDGFKSLDVQEVSFLVMSDFVGPELRVGFWDGVELASLVAVPEAAVDENGGAVSRQDDVGRSGEGADILAEAESAMEQFPADHNFRARVLRPDVRHTCKPPTKHV